MTYARGLINYLESTSSLLKTSFNLAILKSYPQILTKSIITKDLYILVLLLLVTLFSEDK